MDRNPVFTPYFSKFNGIADEKRLVFRDAIYKRALAAQAIPTVFWARQGRTYFPDTTNGVMTGRLGSNPRCGVQTLFVEQFNQWTVNNFTLDGGGHKIIINGLAASQQITCDLNQVTLVVMWDRFNRVWRAAYG